MLHALRTPTTTALIKIHSLVTCLHYPQGFTSRTFVRTLSKMFTDKPWSKGAVISQTWDEDNPGYDGIGIPKPIIPQLFNMEEFPPDMFAEWWKDIDVIMFDCDGVLWMGDTIFKNADALVIKLRAMGKRVYFITNNSTKTRDEFLYKFTALGFETSMDEIISTSYLAALYLAELKFEKKAYVIGTVGVTQELHDVGIRTLPIGPDPIDAGAVLGIHGDSWFDPEVGAVIVGFDQHFNYNKLLKAATYLNDPNCIFIATNTDERFPSPSKNLIIPGTGSIVNAVKTAAEREPIVMGKPQKIPFEFIDKKIGVDPKRTLMIGDRANTDILFGYNCKMYTLLVLSGVTKLPEVTMWKCGDKEKRKMVPNFYLNEVNDLLSKIQESQK